ncbi:hypothetical protein TraAM80_09248 [Trypanosoma rangeli]|uniref:Uncharacterized protein n=1 Tax=Trypanosoma rangeli TaxID=5698 RepID=A0A3R7N6X1_TRYRA|nr:uncharacterized protein TraAM80_09248 [Trypanosoma rangeli]RNE97583.1 hypothetical protein TraAM80_09248 [Trypanosoma rangeli]|eukprot:RNE97583.1 hypothetical protein TraAM80_09248 [Trypanosoma rangeli]
MALSLRDVTAHPADAEAIELLKDEYRRWCVRSLDDDDDDDGYGSGDGEGCNNNSDAGAGADNDDLYFGLPNVTGAFNVRALARVKFPRVWVVPLGTIPAACYANAAVNGGSSMSVLGDYSKARAVVRVCSELLKSPGEGGLPQKVLAMWPERRPQSTLPHLTQKQQPVLYWPAFVTRIVGVFADPLLDGSPACHAKLQAHENFDDILVMALRSPMRVCVDVAFCIDEVSEARRLTIAPAVRYPVGAATTHDPEIARVSELASATLRAGQREHLRAASEADCPLLVPEVMPEVVSIRNYSYTAVPGKGRRAATVASGSAAALAFSPSIGVTSTAGATVAGDAALQSRNCAVGGGVVATAGLPRAKLNRNTLSHSPIALLDMLAGPICHAGKFVFLKPTVQTAVAAQRAAVEELRALWQRLRRARLEPLRAEEATLPSLRAESMKEAAEPPLQLPDPHTYVSPYVQEDRKTRGEMRPPSPTNPSHALAAAGPQCKLPVLQGHGGGGLAGETAWRRRHQAHAHLGPASESTGSAAQSQGAESARRSARAEKSPSLFRTHDPESDIRTPCTVTASQCSLLCEGGTDAGAVGGPARTPNSVGRATASGHSVTLGRSGLWSGNSRTPTPTPEVEPLEISSLHDARRGRQATPRSIPENRETAAACSVRRVLETNIGNSNSVTVTCNDDKGAEAAVGNNRHPSQVVGEDSALSWQSLTWNASSEESSPWREFNHAQQRRRHISWQGAGDTATQAGTPDEEADGRAQETAPSPSPYAKDAFHSFSAPVSAVAGQEKQTQGLSPPRHLGRNDGVCGNCLHAFSLYASRSVMPVRGTCGSTACVTRDHEKPMGSHERATTESVRKSKSPMFTSPTRQTSTAPSSWHLIDRAGDDAASIAVRHASLPSHAARIPSADVGGAKCRNRGHSEPHPRSRASRQARFFTADTARSCRYALTSWRDPSGVEVNVDDARLLPPAVASASPAQPAVHLESHQELRRRTGHEDV